MHSLANAPASIRGWFAVDKSADPEAALRAVLAADVVFDFGGRKAHGIDDVVAMLGFMMPPGWLGEVEWRLRPSHGDGLITVRGVGPDGAWLPSPGGPMDYIDFTFTLAASGRIGKIVPQPHQPEPPDLEPPLQPGEHAPDFTLPDVYGVPVPLHGQHARATVVVFACNHCPFSLHWHERLQQVARDYTARGVRMLQLNPDDPVVHAEDGVEHSRKRVERGEFAGAYLIDHGQVVARRWGARCVPEVFVLDEHGVVAYHGAIDADMSDPSLNATWLRSALEHVLAGASPTPARTQPIGCAIKWTW